MGQGYANQTFVVTGMSAISAGTTAATGPQVVFSNSNGISFGANGNTVTASAAAVNAISASASSISNGTVVFSNSNGFQFGLNGSTVTAQNAPISYWDNNFDMNANAVATNSGGINLSVQRQNIPAPLSATRMDFAGHLTVAGSTAGSYTFSFAVYTLSVSTASRASSTSIGSTFNSGTTQSASMYGGHSGTRWRSVPLATWALTPGDYLFAFMLSQAGVAGTTGSWTIMGNSSVSFNGLPGDGGGNMSAYFDDGIYSAATGAFPNSIHLSDINQTGASVLRQMYFQLAGTF